MFTTPDIVSLAVVVCGALLNFGAVLRTVKTLTAEVKELTKAFDAFRLDTVARLATLETLGKRNGNSPRT
jgi:hypothetical protein